MRLRFLHNGRKNKAERLPKSLRKCFIEQFHLMPEYIDTLACFHSRFGTGVNQIHNIKIFCPSMANSHNIPINNMTDLERNPEYLLYEATIESNGNITISDSIWPSRKPSYYDPEEYTPRKVKTKWF